MEDRKLNEKESLDLIAQMIRNTQNRLEKNSGRPFLIFGYLSLLCALVIWFALRSTDNYQWNYLWFVVPVIAWPWLLFINKGPKFLTTYIDRIVKYLWIVLGAGILIACCFSAVFPGMESLFFSALLMAIGSTLTGLILRFRAFTLSGILGMGISPLLLFLHNGNQLLIFALLFLIMMVIPGHVLNAKSKKEN